MSFGYFGQQTDIPHAIATHPRISADVRRKLLDTMVNLNKDDSGRRLLESLKFKELLASMTIGMMFARFS